MKIKNKYVAIDNREFDSEEECLKHEQLLKSIEDIMDKMPAKPKDDGCSFANGHGYLQHDLASLRAAKDAIFDIWNGPENVKEGAKKASGPTIIGRYLDDSGSPLYEPYMRLACVDSQGWEWGQAYYSLHPEKAEHIRLNP